MNGDRTLISFIPRSAASRKQEERKNNLAAVDLGRKEMRANDLSLTYKSDPVTTCWIHPQVAIINLWIQHVDRRSDQVSDNASLFPRMALARLSRTYIPDAVEDFVWPGLFLGCREA